MKNKKTQQNVLNSLNYLRDILSNQDDPMKGKCCQNVLDIVLLKDTLYIVRKTMQL